MNGKGLNVRLLERRLELDYSVREASIRLDITKGYLYAIECGYLKVTKKLRPRFIRKYGLPKDFFDNDPYLGYPTPISLAPEKEIKEPKSLKRFKSKTFKIITGVLTLGFAAMAIAGLCLQPRLFADTKSFYASEIIDVKNFVKSPIDPAHTYHLPTDSRTGALLLDGFYRYTGDEITDPSGSSKITPAINFYNLDQNLSFSFTSCTGVMNQTLLTPSTTPYKFEVRRSNKLYRLHFDVSYTNDIQNNIIHISADFNSNNKQFTYKLVESIDYGVHTVLMPYEIYYIAAVSDCEAEFVKFINAAEQFFDTKIKGPVTQLDFKEYDEKLSSGVDNELSFSNRVSNLILSGVILGVISLALCALSFIVSFKVDKKIDAMVGMDADASTQVQSDETKIPQKESTSHEVVLPKLASQEMVVDEKYKPLPKNNWLPPVLPEFVIRIITVLILLSGSLGLYFIFQNIINFDIIGTAAAIAYRARLSSLITMATLLLFFTKIDIRQNSKNTFSINFLLFFAGLAFYFLILIVSFSLQSSQSIMSTVGKELMNYLPGNIVWGILSINLLAAFAFNKPNFSGKNARKKTIIFRSLIAIPLAYLLFSFIYSVLKTYAGWILPLPVSSIFFSNNPLTVSFALLYVLFVFIYRKVIDKRYGPNAVIYRTGNRYCIIKNLIIVGIIILLAVYDLAISKIPGNPFGAGKDVAILGLIPIVLLYRPHMGYRNSLWDGLFAGMNVVALSLGILMIGYTLVNYLYCI